MAKLIESLANCFLRIDLTNEELGDGPAPKRDSNTLFFTNIPGDVGSAKSADLTPVNILGRSNPLWVYSSSNDRSWNLELQFFAAVTNSRYPPGATRVKDINDFDLRP